MILCNLSSRDDAFSCEREGMEDSLDLSGYRSHDAHLEVILSWLRDDFYRVDKNIQLVEEFHEE